MSRPENTAAPAETQEPQTALEIAHELLDCMEAEILSIRELRSILVTVWAHADATDHIRDVVGAGINASHFVSNGLDALAFAFKEQLAALEHAEKAAEVEGAA